MKERPILFSAPMVRALLDGTKTQTRRIAPITDLNIKPNSNDIVTWGVSFSKPVKGVFGSYSGGKFTDLRARQIIGSQFCPYGVPGDRLWVRETWAGNVYDGKIIFRADIDEDLWVNPPKWRSSIHLPRAAARINLEITEVRVERLQDISEADAQAEGIAPYENNPGRFLSGHRPGLNFPSAVAAYRDLWESINGAGSWDANPWVWVLGFTRV